MSDGALPADANIAAHASLLTHLVLGRWLRYAQSGWRRPHNPPGGTSAAGAGLSRGLHGVRRNRAVTPAMARGVLACPRAEGGQHNANALRHKRNKTLP